MELAYNLNQTNKMNPKKKFKKIWDSFYLSGSNCRPLPFDLFDLRFNWLLDKDSVVVRLNPKKHYLLIRGQV